MNSEKRSEIINYILKGNAMMKRHAVERERILKQIFNLIQESENMKNNLVNEAMDQVSFLRNEINDLEIRVSDMSSKEAFTYQRLKNLNQLILELDNQQHHKDSIVRQIMQTDANLQSRDELIAIIKEYIDMEKAQNHGLVAEISEVQTVIEEYQDKLYTYDKLAKHDPRFKALEIIGKHSGGISITQLNFMLETSRYAGNKVIQELLEMNLIEQSGSSELLKLTDIFEESFFTVEQQPLVQQIQN
ncbi:MAG: hypothetical protein GPJ54_17885 [Candidatus Heimdallarchaeota archaeon]|nr:hypothetical protein [Candidatus Heimdallarchaeota archaeon]